MATEHGNDKTPRHVAIIMDGNGRWAEARGMPRAFGHQAGAETVRRATEFARRRGIPYLTLYAFSTENWTRPAPEVEALMRLLGDYLEAELPTLMENGVRLRVLGDQDKLSAELRRKIAAATERTAGNKELCLSLAINYGGRDEIVRACRKAAADLAAGGLAPDRLDANFFAARLDTAGMPDPDLVIRTAGEQRLSNFLVWQAAYAEFVFTRCTWPDLSDADFEQALAEYAERVRTFGGA